MIKLKVLYKGEFHLLFVCLFLINVSFCCADEGQSTKKGNDELKAGIFVYDDHGKRDPFWPLVDAKGNIITYDSDISYTDLNLEGIMSLNPNERVAMINGKIIKEGDVIGDYSVVEITSTSVILSKGPKKFELTLKK